MATTNYKRWKKEGKKRRKNGRKERRKNKRKKRYKIESLGKGDGSGEFEGVNRIKILCTNFLKKKHKTHAFYNLKFFKSPFYFSRTLNYSSFILAFFT